MLFYQRIRMKHLFFTIWKLKWRGEKMFCLILEVNRLQMLLQENKHLEGAEETDERRDEEMERGNLKDSAYGSAVVVSTERAWLSVVKHLSVRWKESADTVVHSGNWQQEINKYVCCTSTYQYIRFYPWPQWLTWPLLPLVNLDSITDGTALTAEMQCAILDYMILILI